MSANAENFSLIPGPLFFYCPHKFSTANTISTPALLTSGQIGWILFEQLIFFSYRQSIFIHCHLTNSLPMTQHHGLTPAGIHSLTASTILPPPMGKGRSGKKSWTLWAEISTIFKVQLEITIINMLILITIIEITRRGSCNRTSNRTQEKSDAQYNCSSSAYWGADESPSR